MENGNSNKRRRSPAVSQTKTAPPKKRQRPNKSSVSSIPAALSTTIVTASPSISHSRDSRSVVVSHVEFVAPASTNDVFLAQHYSINPGLATMFPWLSEMSKNYEQYEFEELRFVYIPSVGTDFDGFVALAPEYDVYDPVPATLAEMSAFVGNTVCQSYQRCMVEFDPVAMRQPGPLKYIRKSASDDEDLQESDAGKLVFASDGHATPANSGFIYVEYRVKLYSPQTGVTTRRPPAKVAIFATSSSIALASNTTTTVNYDPVPLINTTSITCTGGVFTLPADQIFNVCVEPSLFTGASGSTLGTLQADTDLTIIATGNPILAPIQGTDDLYYINDTVTTVNGSPIKSIFSDNVDFFACMGSGGTSWSNPTRPSWNFLARGDAVGSTLQIAMNLTYTLANGQSSPVFGLDSGFGGALTTLNRITFTRVG